MPRTKTATAPAPSEGKTTAGQDYTCPVCGDLALPLATAVLARLAARHGGDAGDFDLRAIPAGTGTTAYALYMGDDFVSGAPTMAALAGAIVEQIAPTPPAEHLVNVTDSVIATIADAARRAGVTRATIYAAIERGDLPGTIKRGRVTLVDRDELDAATEAGKISSSHARRSDMRGVGGG